MCPSCLCVCLSFCQSTYLSVCIHANVPACLNIYLPFMTMCLHVFLPIFLIPWPTDCYPIFLSICLSARVSVCKSTLIICDDLSYLQRLEPRWVISIGLRGLGVCIGDGWNKNERSSNPGRGRYSVTRLKLDHYVVHSTIRRPQSGPEKLKRKVCSADWLIHRFLSYEWKDCRSIQTRSQLGLKKKCITDWFYILIC
jgi:hypothetical protein